MYKGVHDDLPDCCLRIIADIATDLAFYYGAPVVVLLNELVCDIELPEEGTGRFIAIEESDLVLIIEHGHLDPLRTLIG